MDAGLVELLPGLECPCECSDGGGEKNGCTGVPLWLLGYDPVPVRPNKACAWNGVGWNTLANCADDAGAAKSKFGAAKGAAYGIANVPPCATPWNSPPCIMKGSGDAIGGDAVAAGRGGEPVGLPSASGGFQPYQH